MQCIVTGISCLGASCDRQQNLFLYIDATITNNFEDFCTLAVFGQMLVAAINPTASFERQISVLLFSDDAKEGNQALSLTWALLVLMLCKREITAYFH